MKLVIFLIINIITISACNNSLDKAKCISYHNGHFKYSVTTNGQQQIFDVFRNDSLQIDVAQNSFDSSFYKINWINECEYELLLEKTNFVFDAQKTMEAKTLPLNTKITIVEDEFYLFSAVRNGSGFVLNDTMKVVKKQK